MTKSNRRDDIYVPVLPNGERNGRYDRVKHSKKVLWDAKIMLAKGEITPKQFKLEEKRAELIVTGQWQHKQSSFETPVLKAQYVQEFDKNTKKSVLSTDLTKTQLPLAEREKQAKAREIRILAIQLFNKEYPSSEIKLQDCEISRIREYLRRAKYLLTNTRGIKRVESHDPNKVKPLKVRPQFDEKVHVEGIPSKSQLEIKSDDVASTVEEPTVTSPQPSPEAPVTPKVTKADVWAKMKAKFSYVDCKWLLENYGQSYRDVKLSVLQGILENLSK